MQEAADLWNSKFKHRNISRTELLTELNEYLEGNETEVNIASNEAIALERSISEGQLIQAERSRRTRERSIVHARLLLDDNTCTNCSYPDTNLQKISEDEILVDVHHIYPLEDGERETKIEDLISLCPNCHRLIHVFGRINGERVLNLAFLKRKLAQPENRAEGL
jgi:predicted HNH restriction endonuclease